jgi:hypothetical protein
MPWIGGIFDMKLAFACPLLLTLAGCATQQAMTVTPSALESPIPAIPRLKNSFAVRSVSGGQAMNVLTVPGVTNEPFKAALESSLAATGYLASEGTTPKFYIDAEIQDLDQPLIGLNYDVKSSVLYKVSGGGTAKSYPIKATGSAGFSDSPLGADRMRIANERAMQESIKSFLQALR